jgi:cytidylate kinase
MTADRTRGLVIAIDGPSGAGKSTVGRALASRLGYVFLDTGAMYRALALKALRQAVPLDQVAALADLAHTTSIELTSGRHVLLDGEDVTDAIRTREVTAASSRVSAHGSVRREMVRRQQELGRAGGVVLDGRDIGTTVFPDAEVKFYLDADTTHRARRRHAEQQAAGTAAELEAVERDLRERDHADRSRADSPLVQAHDALYLDTTEQDADQVLAHMLAVVEERRASRQ